MATSITGTAEAQGPASANYHTLALARGLSLLEMLAERQPLTLTELHEATQLPKSTIVRLMSVFTELGYVFRVDERPAFRLGYKLLHLGTAYRASIDVSARVGEHLKVLAQEVGQTVNLGVLEGAHVLHVSVVEPDRPIRFASALGSRDYTHCTALGKMLLAGLDQQQWAAHLPAEPYERRTPKTITSYKRMVAELTETARRGYAIDDEEGALGLRCLAVPLQVDGQWPAALSISGPAGEVTPERQPKLVKRLRETAALLCASPEAVAAVLVLAGAA